MSHIHIFASLAALLTLATAAAAIAPPPLDYETTIDGYYLASGRGVAIDDNGNAYVHAAHYLDGNTLDILVAKVAPDGAVLWTVVLPGSSHDYATGIAVDQEGDIILAGWTDSGDFPVSPDAIKTQLTVRDAFVMRLSAVDGAVMHSTLFGGDYSDDGRDVAVAPDGTIWLTGSSWSTDFPVVDPLQAENADYPYHSPDLFITHLSADLGTVLYSTLLGGTDDDEPLSMAVTASGDVVIAGRTDSDDFPTEAPLQPAPGGGETDTFVLRLAADGQSLVFSTYLGGNDIDRIGGVAVDAAGNVHVAGSTRSVNFPTTPGAFQPDFVGEINGCEVPFGADYNCEDMFVVKYAADGSSLLYGTFVGGSKVEECRDLAVDAAGCAYLVGYSTSEDFPPLGIEGAASLVVACISADGSALNYAQTMFSGSANAGHGIAVASTGHVVFTGAINVPADVFVGRFDAAATILAAGDVLPGAVRLGNATPNPFNPRTTIELSLDRPQTVQVAVYDVAGRLRSRLASGSLAAGSHTLTWNGADDTGRELPSGTYLLRAMTADGVQARKLMLVR